MTSDLSGIACRFVHAHWIVSVQDGGLDNDLDFKKMELSLKKATILNNKVDDNIPTLDLCGTLLGALKFEHFMHQQ